jgi:preprotein translocase subunit SecG
MANVLIVAYLLIVLALIGVILIQRSEGGGLGMGSNTNGLMTVRSSANLLTRTTGILAALFFATAIGLTILSELDRGTESILDAATEGGEQPTTVLDALQQLQEQTAGDLPLPEATPQPEPAETTEQAADPGLPVPAAPAEGAAPAEPAPAVPAQ